MGSDVVLDCGGACRFSPVADYSIHFVPGTGKACCYPSRGMVVIDPAWWATVRTLGGRAAVLAHERAHLEGAICEACADKRAGEILSAEGYGLRDGALEMLTGLCNRSGRGAAEALVSGYDAKGWDGSYGDVPRLVREGRGWGPQQGGLPVWARQINERRAATEAAFSEGTFGLDRGEAPTFGASAQGERARATWEKAQARATGPAFERAHFVDKVPPRGEAPTFGRDAAGARAAALWQKARARATGPAFERARFVDKVPPRGDEPDSGRSDHQLRRALVARARLNEARQRRSLDAPIVLGGMIAAAAYLLTRSAAPGDSVPLTDAELAKMEADFHVRRQDQVNRPGSTWTDAQLVAAITAAGIRDSREGAYVFALAQLEQGSNHYAVGGTNLWGVHAAGPLPGLGWSLPPDGSGNPIGWQVARDVVPTPFVVWPDLKTACRFMGHTIARKQLVDFASYIMRWNPVIPKDRILAARERWDAGLTLWTTLTGNAST